MNGSIGEMHAKKIAHVYELAVKTGVPVIGLIDCAGMRLQESTDALAGFGQIYKMKAKASGIVPQIRTCCIIVVLRKNRNQLTNRI